MAAINGIDEKHDFRVRLPFREGNTIEQIIVNDWKALMVHELFMKDWDNYCEIAFDMFGPPGEKYSCRLTKEASEFWFKDEQDALMFELRCG